MRYLATLRFGRSLLRQGRVTMSFHFEIPFFGVLVFRQVEGFCAREVACLDFERFKSFFESLATFERCILKVIYSATWVTLNHEYRGISLDFESLCGDLAIKVVVDVERPWLWCIVGYWDICEQCNQLARTCLDWIGRSKLSFDELSDHVNTTRLGFSRVST